MAISDFYKRLQKDVQLTIIEIQKLKKKKKIFLTERTIYVCKRA